jgi:hypothetical protein
MSAIFNCSAPCWAFVRADKTSLYAIVALEGKKLGKKPFKVLKK